ncbi:histidine phosphatase family protein [Streptomyces sp. UNOC14_S4]|uniref:histidine phosphatase family protein n=1 Tax=Streptomyces sp. UNOC14_S4 TaxID=2872340 RepID=UPI001E380E1D|nr:histidine phosphatase family protein [Streptomyces sp. UNOC14_S4]MCC3767589.1 histidine phosphatase family protein [Streptomyces sp. UNOC14_S4]
MTVRVMLVSPATNPALRNPRFDDGASSLDAAGLRQARAAAGALPGADRYLCAPAARCRETADALGLEASPTTDLADLDVGRWTGRTLDDVTAADPGAVAAWLSDPAAAPHGGESVAALVERVGAWLDKQAAGRVLAVVEPAVVRAAAVHALGLPTAVFWRLDVLPLTLTTLTGRSGRWNLRVGQPLATR